MTVKQMMKSMTADILGLHYRK